MAALRRTRVLLGLFVFVLALPLAGQHAVGAVVGHVGGPPRVDFDDWIPIDDPDLQRLPGALRLLPHTERAAFESVKAPWFLLARRVPDTGGFAEAFAADEAVLSKHGKFIPIDEDYFKIRGVEALFLECEWQKGEASMRAAGLYAPGADGQLTVLWIAAPAGAHPRSQLTELKACYRSLRLSFEAESSDVYRSILNGHELSFELRSGRGRKAVLLERVPAADAADRAFFDRTTAAHGWLVADIARNWRDEDRGLSLSMQLFRMDTGLGPKAPFILWVADLLQAFVRRNKDEGDAPVELLHLENARTRVVSQEEIEHHYANNRRAPDAGVILKTFIPRSPFARACRIRFDGKDSRPSLAIFVELRAYPRSKSETVTRACVVMLLARADDAADLDQLEEALAFRSEPLTEPAPLADLPR